VTVIALSICFDVILGFAYREYTVMAFTAVADNFLVIHKCRCSKTKRGVACLAQIASGDVIKGFGDNGLAGTIEAYSIVTIEAIR
jgi:hypothetical protein